MSSSPSSSSPCIGYHYDRHRLMLEHLQDQWRARHFPNLTQIWRRFVNCAANPESRSDVTWAALPPSRHRFARRVELKSRVFLPTDRTWTSCVCVCVGARARVCGAEPAREVVDSNELSKTRSPREGRGGAAICSLIVPPPACGLV